MTPRIRKAVLVAGALALAPLAIGAAKPAHACSADPMLGSICMVGFNFAPRGWTFTSGQLLPIAQNTAVFSLLGTTYGGDGRTTFALPDLRGRVPLHTGGSSGQGPGRFPYTLGERGGIEQVTLNVTQMPAHAHSATLRAHSGRGNEDDPTGAVLAMNPREKGYSDAAPDVDMSSSAIVVANNGGNQPHTNMPPYLAINFVIALQGFFPSRP